MQTRREWLRTAAVAGLGAAIGPRASRAQSAPAGRLRIGMCDWNLRRQDVTCFELAREAGLDGVQVSLGSTSGMFLRDPELQKRYLEESKRTGVAIASTAMGVLNDVPLMSEPKAALWVADGIEITRALGRQVMLLAFFGKGELREKNPEDMRRVTEALVELAPRAEQAGVILGLENYLSAEANLRIIEKVGSPAVRVYYDVYNTSTQNYDVLKEIRLLGKAGQICEVHIKEGRHYLGETGKPDWPAVADALGEIGYRGWLVIETSSPKDLLEDTRRNLAYVRKVFAGLAG